VSVGVRDANLLSTAVTLYAPFDGSGDLGPVQQVQQPRAEVSLETGLHIDHSVSTHNQERPCSQ
jgi:hypothetical protein